MAHSPHRQHKGCQLCKPHKNRRNGRAVREPWAVLRKTGRGNPGDVRPIGKGLSELRLDVSPGYRVYYAQDADALILLLCGGEKSTQQKNVNLAHELAGRWRDERKKEGKQ